MLPLHFPTLGQPDVALTRLAMKPLRTKRMLVEIEYSSPLE